MDKSLMISAQQSDQDAWCLGKGQALRLEIGPGARHLRVQQGRLWLTGQGAPEAPAEDFWLAPGQDMVLPAGSQVVAEGWPQARFELIVPPQARNAKALRGGAWWSRLVEAGPFGGRPATSLPAPATPPPGPGGPRAT